MLDRQPPNYPNTAAPEIKKLAREYLRNHETMTVNDLKNYVFDSIGFTFTAGAYAGAIKTLLDEPGYKKISRGVYTFVDDRPTTTVNNENNSLREQINQLLVKCQADLRKLAIVDLFEADEQVLADISKLREIISGIESLKI